MLEHVERTHRGGTSQTPLSSWGALRTPREPATQAVRDGRDRPALILIPVMCCMLRRMLLGGRVGLGIVIRPLSTKCIQLGLLVSLLERFHRPPCSRTTCLLDIAWLGNLAGQAAVHASRGRIGAYMAVWVHPDYMPAVAKGPTQSTISSKIIPELAKQHIVIKTVSAPAGVGSMTVTIRSQ